jgi:hypothetical protein
MLSLVLAAPRRRSTAADFDKKVTPRNYFRIR